MKTTAFAVALLGFLPAVFAQDAAPSPTESYGCEPHGDHCLYPLSNVLIARVTDS